MYGLLSKRTHISLDQMGLYFKHNKTGGESVLTYTSLEYSLQTLYDFLIVLDIYCSTLECSFARYFKDENKKLLYVTEKRVLKKQRPTKKLVNEYAKKYMQLLG
jgi:hypothetical protein